MSVRSADAPTTARPPRDNLFRAITPGVELRSDDGDIGPVMAGHFAVFNQWTEINSLFEGNFLERFVSGAFRKTFREQRDSMRVLFQHGMDPQLGDKPLGPIRDLSEDGEGAAYEVPLLDASYVRDLVLPGLRAGLYGASFRFRVMREEWVDDPGVSDYNPHGLPERTVKEAQVAEFGPVTFPAYQGATAGVRSLRPSDLTIGVLRSDTERLQRFVARAQRAEGDELRHAVEGLQSLGEAMRTAVELDLTGEPSDEQCVNALESFQSLTEAADGLLAGVGIDAERSSDDDTSTDETAADTAAADETSDAPSERDAAADEPHLTDERRVPGTTPPPAESRAPLYGTRRKETSKPWLLD